MLQIDKNHQFVDGVFLLKLINPTSISLIAMSKGINNFFDDIKSFEYCSPSSEYQIKKECIFVFNNENFFYYTLYFQYQQEIYELVIKSYQRCVHFFITFLTQLFSFFCEDNSANNPNSIFNLAQILISEWPTTFKAKMNIAFPYQKSKYTFTNSDFTYYHFNPTKFFTLKLCSQIFFNLFTARPILLVAPDASIGCEACFSALSLFHPLGYEEPMILWLRKDDPRYIEILKAKGKSPYLVVVTDDHEEIESKFDLVIPIKGTYKIDRHFESTFHDYVKKIFLTIQDELFNQLIRNPYSDILNLPWTGKSMEEVLKNPKFQFMPNIESLKLFERSKSVKNWRLRRCDMEALRNILLQCDDICFDDLSVENLEILFDFLKSMKKNFKNDMHMKAVIKKHSSIVSSILKKVVTNNIN